MIFASHHVRAVHLASFISESADRDPISHLSHPASLSLRLEKRGEAGDEGLDPVVSVTSSLRSVILIVLSEYYFFDE